MTNSEADTEESVSSHEANNKSKSKAKLVQGPVGKTLVKLTIPMIVGIIAILGFGLVDSYFIGLLGTEELAAVGFTFPVGMVLTNIAIGPVIREEHKELQPIVFF